MQKHWDSYESLDWGNEVRSLEEKIKGIFITTGFLPTTGSSPDIALVVDLAEVYFEFKKYDYFFNVLISEEVSNADNVLAILVGIREQVMVGQVLYHIQDAEAFLQKAIVFFSTKAGDINIDVPAPKGYEKLANSEELFEQVSMRLLALGITGIPKDLVPLFSKIYRELNYYDYLIDEFLIVASRNIAGLGKLLEECRICFTMLKNDINLIKRPFNKLINSL